MEQSATKHALRPCVTQTEGAHYVQIDLVAISSQEGRFKSLGTLRWLAPMANRRLLTATATALSGEPTRTALTVFSHSGCWPIPPTNGPRLQARSTQRFYADRVSNEKRHV